MKIMAIIVTIITLCTRVFAQSEADVKSWYVIPENEYSHIAGKKYFVYGDNKEGVLHIDIVEDTSLKVVESVVLDYPCTVVTVENFEFQILTLLPLQIRYEMKYFSIDYERGKREAFVYTGYAWRREVGDGQESVVCE